MLSFYFSFLRIFDIIFVQVLRDFDVVFLHAFTLPFVVFFLRVLALPFVMTFLTVFSARFVWAKSRLLQSGKLRQGADRAVSR